MPPPIVCTLSGIPKINVPSEAQSAMPADDAQRRQRDDERVRHTAVDEDERR